MTQRNNPQEWANDVQFIVDERQKFLDLFANKTTELSHLISQEEALYALPGIGSGDYIVNKAAVMRVEKLAKVAAKLHDPYSSIEPEKITAAVRQLIVERFITNKTVVSSSKVEKLLANAVKQAKKNCADMTHYIPCRLMYAKNPNHFSIGPVLFKEISLFNEDMKSTWDNYFNDGEGKNANPSWKKSVQDVRDYYDDFTWISEVKILNCDREISRERAIAAVTAATNFLHLLFTARHTKRMSVGGSRLQRDQRGHLCTNTDGKLHISCSSSATSPVAIQDGWDILLKREDIQPLLKGIAKAILPITSPGTKCPVGDRFIDAASWFGEAIREQSDAARIVKAITAIERLILLEESTDIAKTLCRRAAALACHYEDSGHFQTVYEEFLEAYDVRSNLVHGSISPFDPKVKQKSYFCVRRAERALTTGLMLFETHGFLDNPLSNRKLGEFFDWLANLVEENHGPFPMKEA